MTERESCLNTAKSMICGEREQDYGTPEDNFAVIARLWNAYLNTKTLTTVRPDGSFTSKLEYGITAKDVSMMMALLKIARIGTGTGTADSFIDLAGYAACGYEIRMKELFNSSSPTEKKEEN